MVGNADDAKGGLRPRITHSNTRKTLTLRLDDLVTNNPALEEYVQGGQAVYATRVESPHAGYNRVFTAKGPSATIEIDMRRVYKRIDLEFGLIAKKAISDFAPSGMHRDYGDARFSVSAGSVIALGGSATFQIPMEWDPLTAPIQSIMRLVRDDDRDSGPMIPSLDSDKIRVRLSRTDYSLYDQRKVDAADILHAAIVLPVLSYAIAELDEEEHSERSWNIRLRQLIKRLEENGEHIEDRFVAAQLLLKNPVERGLGRLQELLVADGEDA